MTSDPDTTKVLAPSPAPDRLQPITDIAVFAAELPAPGRTGRLLGIDPGTKTLGLALSDVLRSIASPLDVIRRGKLKADLAELSAIIAEHEIVGLVVGHPTNMDGTEGPRSQSTRAFARNTLKEISVPLLLWDERLSTAEAERMLIAADQSRAKRAQVIDKLAATLILQRALDRMRHDGG